MLDLHFYRKFFGHAIARNRPAETINTADIIVTRPMCRSQGGSWGRRVGWTADRPNNKASELVAHDDDDDELTMNDSPLEWSSIQEGQLMTNER